MTNLKKEKATLEMVDYVLFNSCKEYFPEFKSAKKAYIKIKCLSHRLQSFEERCVFILTVANHFVSIDCDKLIEIGIPNPIIEGFYIVKAFYRKEPSATLLKCMYSRPSVENVIKLFSQEILFLGVPISCNVSEKDIELIPLSPQTEEIFSKMARTYNSILRKYQPDGFYKNYNYFNTFSELKTICFRLDGEIIGFCNIMMNYCGYTHCSNYHIEDFYIANDYSNVGVGEACAQKILSLFSGICSLDILEYNLKARHFWNKIFSKYCIGVKCIKEMDNLYNYIFVPINK